VTGTLDQVHLRGTDLAISKAFYDRILEPLGIPFGLDTEHLVQFGSLAFGDDGAPTSGA
jgi:hypothetical protein